MSSIDTKPIGGSVVDVKPTAGVNANFTSQSFPLIHTQSSFSNVVPPTQVSSLKLLSQNRILLINGFQLVGSNGGGSQELH